MNSQRYQQVMRIIDRIIDQPDERDQILAELCNGDDSLRHEVEKLLAQQAAAVGFLEESPLNAVAPEAEIDAMIGKRIGPYRITQEIGRGGMGAVYKAVRADDEYKTEVAIKLIKRGMDTDYILRRFRNERQILANLNHPNIARLLDGGSTEDGLPYFVMEYIDGEPIDGYCAARELSIIDRLKLFRAACSAVQYAHQSLVIHRDLKPSNILVTKDGTPKLLDFGIAKLLQTDADGSATALTATELRVMTPDYASPEQIMGSTITTVSDVYSLGVVLYELLTGQRPYRFKTKTVEEVARLISEVEPPKPSKVCNVNFSLRAESHIKSLMQAKAYATLRRDLDAIVMMALRKEPARRYSSVEQFSEDIRRYLKGLPVAAQKDAFLYRAEKFFSRHKLSVSAAAIVLTAVIGGALVTAWQARIARAERARAERRFDDVRKLANSLLFELNDEIAKGPTKARELLVKRALEYLDSLVQEAHNEPSLQRELATAYQKVGDVQSELHGPNVGDSQGALESYRKSLALRESLYANATTDVSLGLEFATSYDRMGDILSKTGVADEALANYRKAVQLIEKLAVLDPKNIAVQRALAQTHIVLGRALLKTSALEEVLEEFRQSVAIRERLVSENPSNTDLQRELPASYESLGYALTEARDVAGALTLYQKSLAINESLLAGEPSNTRLRRAVFDSNWWIGVALAEAGRAGESLAYHRKALTIAEQLSSGDPTNLQARNDLADAYMETANSLNLNNQAAESLALYRKAIENYELVSAPDKRNAHARRQVFYTHIHMGDAQLRSGDSKAATETFRAAVAAFEELSATDPANTEIQNDLANSYRKLGKVLLLKGDVSGAMNNFRLALPLAEKLAAQSPLNLRKQRELAATYFDLGAGSAKFALPSSYARSERLQEACSWYQKSITLWKEIEGKTSLNQTDSASLTKAVRETAKCGK